MSIKTAATKWTSSFTLIKVFAVLLAVIEYVNETRGKGHRM